MLSLDEVLVVPQVPLLDKALDFLVGYQVANLADRSKSPINVLENKMVFFCPLLDVLHHPSAVMSWHPVQ